MVILTFLKVTRVINILDYCYLGKIFLGSNNSLIFYLEEHIQSRVFLRELKMFE